ncbi:MAG: DUF1015 domain-containing protein, partial [Omnitrophica bacterium]|nr:DUF1015 domain-containing protein [Candidatus Omnitrophota bacterium]
REHLYESERHNVVRLILGKEEELDTRGYNKYTRSAALFNEWLKKEILIRDRYPSIYIYAQQYSHKGKARTRFGFIALMKIGDSKKNGVLPHEHTLQKPRKDRLRLIKATRANLSPIFSVFEEKGGEINKILKLTVKTKKPLFTQKTEGVVHRMWRLDDNDAVNKIKYHMRDKKVFIADGHHRYRVACEYRDKMKNTKKFKYTMNYVMMYFSSLSEEGALTVLSTHRAVNNIKQFEEKKVREKLERYFRITSLASIEEMVESVEKGRASKCAFGMYTGKKGIFLLTLKDGYLPNKLVKSKKPQSLKQLDVTILHDLIIEKILGIKNHKNSIKYVRDERDAASLVESGGYQVALFLKPTTVADVKAVAEKGEMMPQKSTYFHPKLLTGLVINRF